MEDVYLNVVVKVLDQALDSDDHKIALSEICKIMKEEKAGFDEVLNSDIHRTLCHDQCDMYDIDLQIVDIL